MLLLEFMQVRTHLNGKLVRGSTQLKLTLISTVFLPNMDPSVNIGPENFTFSIKVHRSINHFTRLGKDL